MKKMGRLHPVNQSMPGAMSIQQWSFQLMCAVTLLLPQMRTSKVARQLFVDEAPGTLVTSRVFWESIRKEVSQIRRAGRWKHTRTFAIEFGFLIGVGLCTAGARVSRIARLPTWARSMADWCECASFAQKPLLCNLRR